MVTYSREENVRWHNSLPSKRMSAGVLLWNDDGELLIVKPNYRDHWNLPGGVIDDGESPLDAAVREVSEELGLAVDRSNLEFAFMSYRQPLNNYKDLIQIVFDGGRLSDERRRAIVLQAKELDAYKFVPPTEAAKCLSDLKNQDLAEYLSSNRTLRYREFKP